MSRKTGEIKEKLNPEMDKEKYEHEDLDKKLQMFYAEVLTKDELD